IHSEKCETFGEPVTVGLRHWIVQEGGDKRVQILDGATGQVVQGVTLPHKITLCGVAMAGVPYAFCWNQKTGGDSKTAMVNLVDGRVTDLSAFMRGVPVSAVGLSSSEALCALNYAGMDYAVTTIGRKLPGIAINALLKTKGGEILGGDRDGILYRLDFAGWKWVKLTDLGGRVFKLAASHDPRWIYATTDGPPRLLVIRTSDWQWREVDSATRQSYGQFGLCVATRGNRVYWTAQDPSKTGCCIEIEVVA
ncbi:MAG: hypothetical protein IT479_13355, partial [Xanthomonadales bacterium]|nr:hypothetical protein [Xanthomonadales bacterium]